MSLMCRVSGHDWAGCRCKRCGEVRTDGHGYDPESGRCGNCRNVEPGYVPCAHDWDCVPGTGARESGETWTSYRCQRCAREEARSHEHHGRKREAGAAAIAPGPARLPEAVAGVHQAPTGRAAPAAAQPRAMRSAEWNNKGLALRCLGRHEE